MNKFIVICYLIFNFISISSPSLVIEDPDKYLIPTLSCDGDKPDWPKDIADMTVHPCNNVQEQGGRVSLRIVSGQNFENLDSFGPFSKLSDPAVTVNIGNAEYITETQRNNLNPVFSLETSVFDLGVRASGTPLKLTVWDKDSGFEFADDLLGKIATHIPKCNIFGTSLSDGDISDSGRTCVEETWLPLKPNAPCYGVVGEDGVTDENAFNDDASCLRVRFTIEALHAKIDMVWPNNTITMTPAASFPSNAEHWGKPWKDIGDQVDGNYYKFYNATGGIFLRTWNEDIDVDWKQYARFTPNMPVSVHVFLRDLDESIAPLWLTTSENDNAGYGGWESTQTKMLMVTTGGSSASEYVSWRQDFGTGVGFYLGGMRHGVADKGAPIRIYSVVMKMITETDEIIVDLQQEKQFDRAAFFILFLQFAFTFLFSAGLVTNFVVNEVDWRLDRVETWMVSQPLLSDSEEGVRGNMLASCFLVYNETESNMAFRWNLWVAKMGMQLVYSTPIVILWAWGIVAAYNVTPGALGFAIMFFGSATLIVTYNVVKWKKMGYLMQSDILNNFSKSFFMLVLFLICSIFIDYGGIQLQALTILFLTLNVIPIIFSAFINDATLSESAKKLEEVTTANKVLSTMDNDTTTTNQKPSSPKTKFTRRGTFRQLIGENTITIDSSIKTFEFEDFLTKIWASPASAKSKLRQKLYAIAVALLIIYSIVSTSFVESNGPLSIVNSFSLIILDSALFLMQRGGATWGPGKISFILMATRASICIGGLINFIMGQTLAFMIFGITVCEEIVARRLPILTSEQAGAVAYFGTDITRKKNYDLAGQPEVVLIYTSFIFTATLMTFVFTVDNQPTFALGLASYPVWVFSVAGVLFVLVYGVGISAKRAFEKDSRGLLTSKWYMLREWINLPEVLAFSLEVLVITSGLLMYALTGSFVILICTVLIPPIIICGAYTYMNWKANDYNLFQTADCRPGAVSDQSKDEADAGDLWNEDKAARAEIAAFTLPPLTKTEASDDNNSSGGGTSDTSFQMPMLPAKRPSVVPKSGLPSTSGALKSEEKQDGAIKEKNSEEKLGEDKENNATVIDVKDVTEDSGGVKSTGTSGEKDGKSEGEGEKESKKKSKKRKAGPKKSCKHAIRDLVLGTETNPFHMSAWSAFWQGKLTRRDYSTFTSANLTGVLVFLWGYLIALANEPAYIGHLLWFVLFVVFLTVMPLVKYFYTYTWGMSQSLSLLTGYILFSGGLAFVFFDTLQADLSDTLSLVLLGCLIWYPSLMLLATHVALWRENKWILTKGNKISFGYLTFMTVLWVWVFYIFASPYWGVTVTMLVGFSTATLLYIQAWAGNQFYLPHSYQNFAKYTTNAIVIIAFCTGAVFDIDLFFCMSIGFIVLIGQRLAVFLNCYMTWEPESPVIFSPFVFPIYVYNAEKNSIQSDNKAGVALYSALLVALFWGVSTMCFINPISLGSGMVASTLVLLVSITTHLTSLAPVRLAEAASLVDRRMLDQCARGARWNYSTRRKAFEVLCDDVSAEMERQIENAREIRKLGVNRKKMKKSIQPRRSAIVVAREMEEINMDLYATQDDNRYQSILGMKVDGGDGLFSKSHHKKKKQRRRHDALLSTGAAREILWDKYGPGWLKCLTNCKKKAKNAKYKAKNKSKKVSDIESPSEIRHEDDIDPVDTDEEDDYFSDVVQNPFDFQDSIQMLQHLRVLDQQLNLEYMEEIRCKILFEMLTEIASIARLRREGIQFQRFLRENRFKLLANDIAPPSNIFKSQSFATVDVGLVSNWLFSLTYEQKERFNTLKSRFTEEDSIRSEARDNEDNNAQILAVQLKSKRENRDYEMCCKRYEDFLTRRAKRREKGIEDFETDEDVLNAKERLEEISKGDGVLAGDRTIGRINQYHDREFPPDLVVSIGECEASEKIAGWKAAPGINNECTLFEQGTDPDDIFQGELKDGWLLSAISIVSASGGVDDGQVDPLIAKLFIQHEVNARVGAYAVRLFKNGQWETLILDDFFPILEKIHNNNERSAGAAMAHSQEFKELWVPLLEKAYAKYYGSYGALEKGFVHFALKDLTGAESEEIFLSSAGKGANRLLLWKQMLSHYENQFLLGAGTVTSSTIDRELLDSGLVFGATYVIYQVCEEDGQKLIKLRNPPRYSDDEVTEWRGDWSDHSSLWTKRLRKKCKLSRSADDAVFWMSFDDFVVSFRSLYVCKYLNSERWIMSKFSGWWKVEDGTAAGAPGLHNELCHPGKNPQFSLRIDRPTDLIITLSQTDDGMAVAGTKPHNIGFFITKNENCLDKPFRVEELTHDTIVGSTGEMVKERTIQLSVSLKPRTYNLMLCTFMQEKEGPWTLSIHSNFTIGLDQIWPNATGEWKQAANFADKMKAMASDKSKRKSKVKGGGKKVIPQDSGDGKEAEVESDGKAGETTLKAETPVELMRPEAPSGYSSGAATSGTSNGYGTAGQSTWTECYDPTAQCVYYYNTVTGESAWDKPVDYWPGTVSEEVEAATKLQSVYRGHQSRKSLSP